MKRWIVSLGVFLFVGPLPLWAHLRVVASTTDLAAIAREVGKNQTDVISLLPADVDPHKPPTEFQDTPQLRTADIVLVVGLEYERSWLLPFLVKYGRGRFAPTSAAYFDASDACDILERPGGAQSNRGYSGVHPFGNPHYWLDPENGRHIARALVERFSELDPSHAVAYQENLREFETALTQKETEWNTIADSLGDPSVITYHASWPYFAEAFHLNPVGVIEPWPGSAPDVARAGEAIGWVRDQRVSLVLIESYVHSTMPQGIAAGAGAKAVVLPTSVGGIPEVKTYFDLFDYDLKLLQQSLE